MEKESKILKTYIKQIISEAFVNADGEPYKYYYFSKIFKPNALENLLDLRVEAQGFSDSPTIFKKFISRYDYFIIMDGEEFREINSKDNFDKIDYGDINDLLKNKMKKLKRLFEITSEELFMIHTLIRFTLNQKKININIIKNDYIKSIFNNWNIITDFLSERNKFRTFDDDINDIDQFTDFFINIIKEFIFRDDNIEHYGISCIQEASSYLDNNKEIFKSIFSKIIKEHISMFTPESEVLTKNGFFNIPLNSKIYFVTHGALYSDLRKFVDKVIESGKFQVKYIPYNKAQAIYKKYSKNDISIII